MVQNASSIRIALVQSLQFTTTTMPEKLSNAHEILIAQTERNARISSHQRTCARNASSIQIALVQSLQFATTTIPEKLSNAYEILIAQTGSDAKKGANPSLVTVKCYETQISIQGGVCARDHTIRICGESQGEATMKGALAAESVASKSESVCAEDITYKCKGFGGTPKTTECPSCEILLREESVNCIGDDTCEMNEYGSAVTRTCCPTKDESKKEADKRCNDVDQASFEALWAIAMAFVGDSCAEDNCVNPTVSDSVTTVYDICTLIVAPFSILQRGVLGIGMGEM